MTPDFVWSVGDSRTFSHEFTLEDVKRFADLTGDTNPLHTDPAYARTTSAGGQVVHGMLAASFVSTLIGMHIPGRGALWNSFEIGWRKMIRIGDVIEFTVQVARVSAATSTLDLEIVGVHASTRDIHLQGKARVMALWEEKESAQSKGFADKTFLVTGASGEVGASICRRLVQDDARVIAIGRDQQRLRELQAELGDACPIVRPVDLLDPKALSAFLVELSAAEELYGLVHAASPPLRGANAADAANAVHLHEHFVVSVEAFQQIVSTAVPLMTGGGSIVTILTQSVYDVPAPRISAYVSAKMALWGLTRSLAAEYGPKGIRSNAVSPGLVNTPFTSDIPVRFKQIEEAGNPMRRLCTTLDIANAVAFLCGPEGAFINGVNLPVTGGARMV